VPAESFGRTASKCRPCDAALKRARRADPEAFRRQRVFRLGPQFDAFLAACAASGAPGNVPPLVRMSPLLTTE
jgi:hypothetical protein